MSWYQARLTMCDLCLQVMLEQRVTARDEQFNYSTSPYIQVIMAVHSWS
jgi:hypothetical protein